MNPFVFCADNWPKSGITIIRRNPLDCVEFQNFTMTAF